MKKAIVIGGIMVAACVIALAVHSGCGSSGSSNPVSSAMDSLPAANLSNSSNVSSAAGTASSAASEKSSVPSTSDFAAGGTHGVSPFMLKVLSTKFGKLPIAQRTLALKALGGLTPQTVTPGCPTITDNSTYPSGTSIDVTYDFNGTTGCSPTTGVTFVGSFSLKGTVSDAAGSANVTLAFNNYGMQMTCTSSTGTSGNVNIVINGSLTMTANGLLSGSTSFSVTENGSFSISASSSCGGESASGFVSINVSLAGTKTGSVWAVTVSDVSGDKVVLGSYAFGAYQDWGGTIDITEGTPVTATVNLSGQIGWEMGSDKGKVTFKLADVVINDSVCFNEPASGTLTLTAGSNTAEIDFDGQANSCGGAPWKLNGTAQGILYF